MLVSLGEATPSRSRAPMLYGDLTTISQTNYTFNKRHLSCQRGVLFEINWGFGSSRFLHLRGWRSWVHRKHPRNSDSEILSLRIPGVRVDRTASFQTINLDKWAEPLRDLNFQRACWSETKQWVWDFETLNLTFCAWKLWELIGQFLNTQEVVYFLPDPGALSSCMHTSRIEILVNWNYENWPYCTHNDYIVNNHTM